MKDAVASSKGNMRKLSLRIIINFIDISTTTIPNTTAAATARLTAAIIITIFLPYIYA